MLWYKSWLETRVRLVFLIAVLGFMLFVEHSRQQSNAVSPGKGVVTALVMMTLINVVVVSAVLGGAGIATQPSLAVQRGTHGSTLYTVSLPVSRLRLLLVRTVLGWIEATGIVTLFCAGLWLFVPWLQAAMTGVEMVKYLAALLACGSVFYCVAVLLGSFLEDQWRAWGTMFTAAALAYASKNLHLPAFADVFRGMALPVTAHTMPWSTMAFSLGMAAALLVATKEIVQRREY